MRVKAALCLVLAISTSGFAHHPDSGKWPVRQPIDVIGPIGNRLPAGHRRTYNRPTYLGGKLSYWLAPTSQEAMAWHNAEHRGDYDCDRGRVVPQYFYAKPYEAMRIGSRRSLNPEFQAAAPKSRKPFAAPKEAVDVPTPMIESSQEVNSEETNPLLQKLELNDLSPAE